MKFQRATLSNCAASTGIVIVIDVVRAFTTAAFAFASGARQIFLVRSVEQAFCLKEGIPGAMLVKNQADLLVLEAIHELPM